MVERRRVGTQHSIRVWMNRASTGSGSSRSIAVTPTRQLNHEPVVALSTNCSAIGTNVERGAAGVCRSF